MRTQARKGANLEAPDSPAGARLGDTRSGTHSLAGGSCGLADLRDLAAH